MQPNVKRIVSASAIQVLGEYNHSFSFTSAENFAILYGPNGVGKTKFLEIIHAGCSLDGPALSRLPFRELHLEFSDDSVLTIVREQTQLEWDEETETHFYKVHFRHDSPGEITNPWTYSEEEFLDFVKRRTRYEPLSGDYWQDSSDNEIIHIDQIRKEHEFYLQRRAHMSERVGRPSHPGSVKENDTLAPDSEIAVQSFLIETQRLKMEIEREPRGPAHRFAGQRNEVIARHNILEQSEQIRRLINRAQTEHSNITQELDRSFPHRVLMSDNNAQRPSESELRERYSNQSDFRSSIARIASVALDEQFALPDRPLNETEIALLEQYSNDAGKKLEPFRDLMERVWLLEEILNARLNNKSLTVTNEHGLVVRNERTKDIIPLDALSSGEQHVVILMTDLLFNVPTGALVLIDEPEISMHIAWQMAFIPDVEQISKLVDFDFVVATHSPQIIDDRWDRAVSLGGLEA